MKAEDIVNALRTRFPIFNDSITTNFGITSLTRSGTTVTCITDAPHDLSINDYTVVSGAQTTIDITSITRVGTLATIFTSSKHDMTKNIPGVADVSGANEPEFNGVFNVVNVPNRQTIVISVDDSGPTVATGSPRLNNGSSAFKQYNGLQQVTATPTTTSFQYEITDSTLSTPAAGAIIASTQPRVSAAVTIDRVLDSYTRQPQSDVWLFVVLEDVAASKNRNILSDAVDNLQRSNFFRQQVIQGVSIYAVIPSSDEIAGRVARDLAEDLFRPICQSVLFERFATALFSNINNPLQFVDHGFENYNTSYYVHRYTFQQMADLSFEDTVGFSVDTAFRDIDLSIGVDFGTEFATAEIDLDLVPL